MHHGSVYSGWEIQIVDVYFVSRLKVMSCETKKAQNESMQN